MKNKKKRIKKRLSSSSSAREYKDGMFRALFNSEKKALKLYCDITGKTFPAETVVEMKSLNNILLSKLRNDIAFIVDDVMVIIIDHQSTPNNNMPLRFLQYVQLFYEIFTNLRDALYYDKIIPLPKPEFYVLYNGEKAYAPSGVLKLSDAFQGLAEGEIPQLELLVNVININYDEMPATLKQNEDIAGYAIFIQKVRNHLDEGKILKEAIQLTTRECLDEGILTEFLSKFKDEVDTMFSLVYDEKRAMEVARKEAHEEGLVEGRVEGRVEGIELSAKIINELNKKTPIEEIATRYKTSIQTIDQLRSAIKQVSA